MTQRSIDGILLALGLLAGLGNSSRPCHAESVRCVWDLDGNGIVDPADLALVLLDFGSCIDCETDYDGDGSVDTADVAIALLEFGACAEPSWATVVEWMPDPNVVTDPDLRSRISSTHLPWRVRDKLSSVEMLLVPDTSFVMGASEGDLQADAGELPRHSVTITRPFYLGKFEVTQAEWKGLMGENPSFHRNALDSDRMPVEMVSAKRAQEFLGRADLRLPTEAEWELACRAGVQAPRYCACSSAESIAWTEGNSGGCSHAVGGRAANALGFYDMLGNVHEWVADARRAYSSESQIDPVGTVPLGPQSLRIHRGGSWLDGESGRLHRASWRSLSYPDTYAWPHVGVRAARNP